ncbi:MAG: YraN family protein [Defluviitaleaceae bacterium]|nr:YraN family protein [Defluviitaleaceae bacterium]
MPNKVETGFEGQNAAEKFLTEKGLSIIGRNYRIKSGEIDLIARDGEYVVFVEVKYRKSLDYGYPREAVGARKQMKIKRTSLHYIQARGLCDCGFRYDVVEILKTNAENEITHIENAFM